MIVMMVMMMMVMNDDVSVAFGRLLNHDYVTFMHVLTAAQVNSHPDYKVSSSLSVTDRRLSCCAQSSLTVGLIVK